MSRMPIRACSSEQRSMAVVNASLMASIPSYEKHVTSTSARSLIGWGVSLRRMFFMRQAFKSASLISTEPENMESGSTIAWRNASYACPYFL